MGHPSDGVGHQGAEYLYLLGDRQPLHRVEVASLLGERIATSTVGDLLQRVVQVGGHDVPRLEAGP